VIQTVYALVISSQFELDGQSYIWNQFKSKTLFKDGDPVSLQLIFPGANGKVVCFHSSIKHNIKSSSCSK